MRKTLGLLKKVQADVELKSCWEQLSPDMQKKLKEVDEGLRVPDMLNDAVFKTLFHPDKEKKRLSSFLSSVLGRNVEVIGSLDKEGYKRSVKSKGIVLDILARFEDGTIANVEIQREGLAFPPQRSAVYSAELVARQYAIAEGEEKKDIDYTKVKPVYTIIMMEHSAAEFLYSNNYVHHFAQRSDTGLNLEHLQYYDYICLDIFREKKPRIAGELEKWLTFLSIEKTEDMDKFLAENPYFQSVYDYAILMINDREEMLHMFASVIENEDILGSLKATQEGQIRQMKEQLAEKEEQLAEREEQLAQKDEKLKKLEMEIARLKEGSVTD